jgi:hypothetical protein
MLAGQLARRKHLACRKIRGKIGRSGIVVGHVTAVIPLVLLSGTNFMKRKNAPCESGAEQNKSARPRAFRTNSDFSVGKSREGLPEIATLGTKQSDIDTWNQWRLRVNVRRNLMRPMGLLHGDGRGGA